MSGLREKQKAERKLLIRETALRMFKEKGYKSVKVDDIAAEVGMSVPTLFKYYSSKHELLCELISDYDPEPIIEKFKSQIDMERDDPVNIICELEWRIAYEELTSCSPSLWREMMPSLLFGQVEALPEAYIKSNEALIRSLVSFFEEMKAHGHFASHIDLEVAARYMNDFAHMQMIRLTRTEPLDWKSHREQVHQVLRMMYEGMKP